MTNPYTPEKVVELVARVSDWPTIARMSQVAQIEVLAEIRDALTAVSAERDAAIRDLDAGFAESDHLSAKYYQRMRDAEREMHARELHHFESEKAIEEALAYAEGLDKWRAFDGRGKHLIGILRAALDKEGETK